MLKQSWFRPWRLLAGFAIVLTILGSSLGSVVAARDSAASESAASTELPVPQSLEELVRDAQVIVVGTVESFLQYSEARPYRNGLPLTDAAGNLLRGIPTTDYLLSVETVIRDDGTIARGEPIVLREPYHVTDELRRLTRDSEYPLSSVGDRYLFALGRFPDGTAYGPKYGPWGRLIIDGDILRLSNATRDPLQFGNDGNPIALEEFIATVEKLDESSGGAGIDAAAANRPVSPLPTPAGTRVRGTADQYGPPPYNLYELITPESLVVVATVGPVARYTVDCGTMASPRQTPCNADNSWPVTDFEMKVEQVIRDTGSVSYGEPVWLREQGYVTAESKQQTQNDHYPVSYTGDRYLYILYPVDGEDTYVASHGPWGRLIIDADILRLSNATQDPLQFDDGGQVTLEELKAFAQRPW